MKKLFILLAIFTTVAGMSQSVGINDDGSAANASAMLDVSSTTKGFLPPRMTYTQRQAISTPAQGLIIYCTNCGTSGETQVYNGSEWVNMTGDTAANQTQPVPIDNYVLLALLLGIYFAYRFFKTQYAINTIK